MAMDCADVFTGTDGESRVPVFNEVRAAFETALQRCVWLGQADGVGH